MSKNMIGALLMMASMMSFTVNDGFVKMLAGELPLSQLLAVRGVMTTVLILALALALRNFRLNLGRQAWTLVLIRCGTEIAASYFFLTALFHMPLANVVAIMQALPLTVALGAFLMFREPVGWRRSSAIFIGFIGMLLIVRPGPDGFSTWSIYALIAVVCVTARDLLTKKLPPNTPSLTVAFTTALSVTLWFGVASLAEPWAPIEQGHWGLLAGAALFIFGGYFFSVQTMRVGEISFSAPFRYTSLIWALILGWIMFGDWPDSLTLLGAFIVVAAGLFTLWREAQLRRRAARAALKSSV